MEFNNVIFLFLVLPLFLICHHFLSFKFKNAAILFFSFLVIYWGFLNLFFVMLFVALLNYFFVYIINKLSGKKLRTFFLIFVLILNFSALFYIKFNKNLLDFYVFSVPILKDLFIYIFFMNVFSFVVDVYKFRAFFSNNILNYLVYVFNFLNFFSGPVVCYYKIQKSIEKRTVKFKDVVYGFERFIFGLFKVCVVAYEMGQIKRFVFLKSLEELSFLSAWLGAFAIFLNCYFYFSGYCDMAIGLGRLCGFSFSENFSNRIFFKSLKGFFENFNISFVKYFKFYIFPWALQKNMFLKFLKWFIIYGLFNLCFDFNFAVSYFFILIFLECLLFKKFFVKLPKFIRKIYSFVAILIGFVIFFQNDLNKSLKYLKCMFFGSGVFYDKSLVFVVSFLRVFIVLALFFLLNIFLNWLKKPNKKHENLALVIKNFCYLILFLGSIGYSLTV